MKRYYTVSKDKCLKCILLATKIMQSHLESAVLAPLSLTHTHTHTKYPFILGTPFLFLPPTQKTCDQWYRSISTQRACLQSTPDNTAWHGHRADRASTVGGGVS